MTYIDVFLSYASVDEFAVEQLARKLRDSGLEPFLDRWHLIPGEPWQEALEKALDQSRVVVVFVGKDLGPWQTEEMRSALDTRSRNSSYRVIPVLLPGGPEMGDEKLPRFLRRFMWVDYRGGIDDEDAFRRLVAGVRGETPGPGESKRQGRRRPITEISEGPSSGVVEEAIVALALGTSDRMQVKPSTAQPQGYHLFLSSAAEDRDFAERLVGDLEGQGINVLWDGEVRPGESIRRRIEQGLKASDRFAVVLSPESLQSSWVNVEIDAAFFMEAHLKKTGRGESFLIPILYKACEVPLLLSIRGHADFTVSYEKGLKELLRELAPPREQESPVAYPRIPIRMLPDALILISYAACDESIVAELYEGLEALKIPVWLDSSNLRGSSGKLPSEIETAIEQARHCIIVLSPGTVNFPWMRRKIAKALEVKQSRQADGYRVIPVLLPGLTQQALEFWFEEPVAQPIEVGPEGLSAVLPALLAALDERPPDDSQQSKINTRSIP